MILNDKQQYVYDKLLKIFGNVVLEKEEIIKQAKIDAEKEKKIANEAVQKEASVLVVESVRKIMDSYVKKGKGEDIINAMLARQTQKGGIQK